MLSSLATNSGCKLFLIVKTAGTDGKGSADSIARAAAPRTPPALAETLPKPLGERLGGERRCPGRGELGRGQHPGGGRGKKGGPGAGSGTPRDTGSCRPAALASSRARAPPPLRSFRARLCIWPRALVASPVLNVQLSCALVACKTSNKELKLFGTGSLSLPPASCFPLEAILPGGHALVPHFKEMLLPGCPRANEPRCCGTAQPQPLVCR